jgi:hypothetical protein
VALAPSERSWRSRFVRNRRILTGTEDQSEFAELLSLMIEPWSSGADNGSLRVSEFCWLKHPVTYSLLSECNRIITI